MTPLANPIAAGKLGDLMRDALCARGLSDEHIRYVVDGLLETSLRGIDTHGVRLFPTYIAELDGGRSRPHPKLTWSGTRQAAQTLDAGAALGLVAGRVACARAVSLANLHGIGAVSVRNSNHFGAASVFTLAMARSGVLGLAFTNSDALVAPHHGIRPLFGTNPMSMAVQGENDDMFCADLATSQVSYSNAKERWASDLPLESGWAITNCAEIVALKPLGGHKGHCLSMMVEILCALLAGMPQDHELSHLYSPPYNEPRNISHLFVAIEVDAFVEAAGFRRSLSSLLAAVRSQPAEPGERVVVPGEPETECAAGRLRNGIPLSEDERRFFAKLVLGPMPVG